MAVPFRVLGARSTAIDTVEVSFNHDVNPSLTEDNFSIAQAYGMGPLKIVSISIKYNDAKIVALKTHTQIPFMFYKISMTGVRSLHTNELVDTNYSNNVSIFDGFSESNSILDRMVDSMSPITSSKTKVQPNAVEVETNVSKFFRGVSDEVSRLYKEMGNTAMDNYLSLSVTDERVIRGKGNYDRLGKYGAFEITRVSKEPSYRAIRRSEVAQVYFDGDVQLITQSIVGSIIDEPTELDAYGVSTSSCTIPVDRFASDNVVSTVKLTYDAPELINAGRFLRSGADDKCITVVDAEEAEVTATPYALRLSHGPILKVLFVLNATTGLAYPLTSYALKNNFYDANNSFMDTRLSDVEFRLNPSVGGFAPPAAGDKILVVYSYNNSTRSVIPGSVRVTAKTAIPSTRLPGVTIPSEYSSPGVDISNSDIGDESVEPQFGPSYLEPANLQGLYYKLSNVNTLDESAEVLASPGATSLAIFTMTPIVDEYGVSTGILALRVDGQTIMWPDPDSADPENPDMYNVNPFVTELPWDPAKSGRLSWGSYMVNYSVSESLVPETQIEYGVPTIDSKPVPARVARERLLEIPQTIYASYLYLAEYQEDVDYSLIIDTKNIFTINPMLIGAITPISSTSSRLSSGQMVSVEYQYENVFVQSRDYALFANVEACYERVENRVSVNSDGNVSISTLHYPLEEVNSVFSEGTGVKYPITMMHDNYVEIQGAVSVKDAVEVTEFKVVQDTIDVLAGGNIATLSNAMILDAEHSVLGGNIYVDVQEEGTITSMVGDGATVVVTTGEDHYLDSSSRVVIRGSSIFSGTYDVFSVLDQYHFSVIHSTVGSDSSAGMAYGIDSLAIDRLGVRTAYLAGSDTVMQTLVADAYESGYEESRLAGIGVSGVYSPFIVSPATIGNAYYKTRHPESIVLFDAAQCESVSSSSFDSVYNISQLGGCFSGRIGSSVVFEQTICVYDGGGFCLMTKGHSINANNADRPSVDGGGLASSQIDADHLAALSLTTDGYGNITSDSGKTSPNNFDTPDLCTDTGNVDPNLYNLYAPCKSFSCCGYSSMFSKEVPFVDGKTEFYRQRLDLANRPVLDTDGLPVFVRREPYGAYSIDYVAGVVHSSLDPASVAVNTQKQVTATYATAAFDTKNPYITKVDGVSRQSTGKIFGGNAQVEIAEIMRVDRFDIGTIYLSDICRFDGSVVSNLSGKVNSIAIVNAGSGYTATPSVSIKGGGGSGASARAIISGGEVVRIVVDSGGGDYSSIPTVTIQPPALGSLGVQAKAVSNVATLGLSAPRCTNYPYALSNIQDQFQGKYTPTGCIYDQSTTGYSVCAKMDGVVEALGSSPLEADPDYIYRLSTTSKLHGICIESSCRFYTASGKQKSFVGTGGRGLYYPSCRNSMCSNYQPVYLGDSDSLLAKYSYVADSLVIDYVYGDNGIDWSPNLSALQGSGTRYIGVQDDGEPYYVSYKIGAREKALYNNFAYALGTPLLDVSSRRWAKEMYRKAIVGVISAYLAGPTFLGIDALVETFTGTPPEILEGTTIGWILGENYTYTRPESLSGPVLYTRATATSASTDPFNLGLSMSSNDVLKYDAQDNFKISSGSLDMFIAPEWQLKNKKVIVDLYQNNSQSLRGAGILVDPGIYSGLSYSADAGLALVDSVGTVDYVIDAHSVVAWKDLIIDTQIIPSFIDEANKITIAATVRSWNLNGQDGYTDQTDNCGMYGFAYTDEYAPEYNESFSLEFETVTGTNGQTCPTKDLPACAVQCTGDECIEAQCDCLSGCNETLFIDVDSEIAAHAYEYIGRYITFVTSVNAGQSFVANGVTSQLVPQTSVRDMHTLIAHTNPQVGDSYIVPSLVPQFTPTGSSNAWYGNENKIAVWSGLVWVFSSPLAGRLVWVDDASYQFKWTGSQWSVATDSDTTNPSERSYTEKLGFVLTGLTNSARESGIVYRIHNTPQIKFPLGSVPTSRYLRVSLTFTLDKTVCDEYGYGDNYGSYPSYYEAYLTCGTMLGISNIEVFYTNPVCAFEAPVISTLFDVWDESSGDMFSNRMSIFRDQDNILRFRVYETKEAAVRHLEALKPTGLASFWPAVSGCRSYYEVVVDLSKIYNDNASLVKTISRPCGLDKSANVVGGAEWTTRRRHYFGFTWALNDGFVACADKNSNLHVFVDGSEYPSRDQQYEYDQSGNKVVKAYDPIGWVNHGLLCPDGTLYEYEVKEQTDGLSLALQVDKFTKRKDSDSFTLCEKPKVDARLIDIYLEGWVEDTTIQWSAPGKTDDVPLPINMDYTGNIIRLNSTDSSTLWPCSYDTGNSVASVDDTESRLPAGIYVSSVYDSLVSPASNIDPTRWSAVSINVSSSNIQRKRFSRARVNCDGGIIDACDFDNCYGEIYNPEFPVIDIGGSTDAVKKAIKLSYRASEYADFVESGVDVPWVIASFNVSPSESGVYGGEIIPKCSDDLATCACTDLMVCSAAMSATGRYLQYRIEIFSDGTFTPIIYSVDFGCDKMKINDFIFAALSDRELYVKPISVIGVD